MPGPIPFMQQGASRTKVVTRNRVVRLVIMFGIIIIMITGLSIYLLGDFGTGYRFTVSGMVTYTPGFAGTPGDWTINSLSYSTPERDWSVLSTLWSWSWESGDVKVVAEIGNIKVEQNLGKYIFTGGTEHFEVEFRHIDVGSHSCFVSVVEMDCGIIPINCDETVVVTDHIQINVVGE